MSQENTKLITKTTKPFSLYALSIFVLLFPILEGYSNSVIPVGTVGIGLLVISVWFIEIITSQKLNFKFGGGVLFLFVFWMGFSVLWSRDQGYSLSEYPKYVMVFLLYVMASDIVSDRKGFILIVRSYLLGVFLVAVSGINNILSNSTYNDTSNRYSADGFDPNNFGIILASAVPLIWIAFTMKNWYQKVVSLLITLFFVVLILSSASRAATISVFLSILGIMVFYGSKKIFQLLIAFGLLLGLVSLGVLTVIPQASLDRLSGGVESDGGGGRSDIWTDAISLGMMKFWSGYGVASSFPIMGVQSHNTFVSAFFEGGILAVFLWGVFWFKHFQFTLKARLMNKRDPISMLLFFSLVSLLVGALTLNWEYRKTLYLLFGLSSAWYGITRRDYLSRM